MDFQTRGDITLRPGDERIGYSFDISRFIPSNVDATSVSCVIYSEDGTDVTQYILYGSPSISEDVVTANLSHSANVATGRYKIIFYLGINAANNPQRVCRFYRLYIEDL